MRFSSIAKLAVAAALALAAGSANAENANSNKTRCLFQPGLTEWYNGDPSNPGSDVIGYQDVTCECIRQGPYGWISEYEVFTPYTC